MKLKIMGREWKCSRNTLSRIKIGRPKNTQQRSSCELKCIIINYGHHYVNKEERG